MKIWINSHKTEPKNEDSNLKKKDHQYLNELSNICQCHKYVILLWECLSYFKRNIIRFIFSETLYILIRFTSGNM